MATQSFVGCGQQEHTTERGSYLLVAAIDFGTTFSGYAFSLLHEFKKDPLKISVPNKWTDGSALILQKTPTVLYYDPRTNTKLFGYEAENKYIDAIQDKDKTVLKRSYYFSLFKMGLYGQKSVCENLEISDISGKKMKALDVFGMSLEWLKENLLYLLKTRGYEISQSEIRWVITVPAIWNDSAKQLMRLAGERAGISSKQLFIALEAEAASVYCQHLPIERNVFPDGEVFSELETGKQFMVADLGGGTADITVHQKLPDNYLREILSASGGNCGGSAVNDAYLKFWISIVGDKAFSDFQRDFKEAYMDVLREFEHTKRKAAMKERTKVTVKISTMLNDLCEKHNNGKSIKELADMKYKGTVEVVQDRLRIFTESFKSLFDPTISRILGLIQDNLHRKEASGVNLVILVGGFAECNLVKEAICAAMADRNIKVVVPEEAGLAVLKGAAIFGHNPKMIQRHPFGSFTTGQEMATQPFVAGDQQKGTTERRDYFLVAAIDFGTKFSGYAFSLLHDFKKNPLKISVPNKWTDGSALILQKTPTVLYYDPQTKTKLFGYEAENKYIDAIQDKDREVLYRSYYFSLFKMELYGHKSVCENLEISDISGKKMKALDVFGMSLEWLKEHLLDLLKTRGYEFSQSEIRWVITVPAIWNDSAKQFMRLAGERAGISSKQLFIALEAEAASVYCHYLLIERHVFPDGGVFSELETGKQFMVADLGGGTADITVHQKLPDNYLREILSASGGNCGGSAVNDAYLKFWISIVGDKAFSDFQRDFKEAYMDVLREFEYIKRNAAMKERARVTVKISTRLNDLCEKHNNGKSIKELAEMKYKGTVEVVQDKMRIFIESFKSLFDPTISGILSLIQDNLHRKEASGVKFVILVGGFAECNLVREAICAAMADRTIKVVVPDDAGLAAVKGAAIFGHNPKIIQSRIMNYTYGISAAPYFDSARHSAEKRIEMHGKYFCRDVFSPFMLKGTSVEFGHTIKKRASTVEPFQENLNFKIYFSNSAHPKYTTDSGCEFLGDFTVKLEELTQHRQEVEVEYEFGMAEIRMTARVDGGPDCETSFQLKKGTK